MKLSSRARYAVRLMVELDRLGGQHKPVHLAKIASITGISKRYLEQIAIALKTHSLLRGISGRNGGYRFARPPAEISIGAVLTAVIGPVNLSVCVVQPDNCMRADFCECRLIWSLLNQRVNNLLEEYSIADLSDKDVMSDIRRQLESPPRVSSNADHADVEPAIV